MADSFIHPRRFPANVSGDFYTTGQPCVDGGVIGDCLQCEAPEGEAPELLAVLNDQNLNTYFIRQPETETEVERACNALRVCCVAALRYGGRDRNIIRRLDNSPEYCDYIINADGTLICTVGPTGELLPFAQSIVDGIREAFARDRDANG